MPIVGLKREISEFKNLSLSGIASVNAECNIIELGAKGLLVVIKIKDKSE